MKASGTFERNMCTAAKGSGILTAGRFCELVGGLAIAFLLARILGASEYGLYALALHAATIVGGAASLGMDSTMVRYVALLNAKRDEAGLWGTLQIGISVGLGASLLMGIALFVFAETIAIRAFDEPALIPLLQVLSLVVPCLTLSNVLVGAVHGFKRMDYSVIAECFVRLLVRLVLVAVLAFVGLSAFRVAIIFCVSDLAAAVVLVYLLNKQFSLKRPLSAARRDVREIVSFSWPLWLSGLLKKFRKNIEAILLGSLSTMANVGVFTLISKLNLVGRVSYRSINASVKPVFAELYAHRDWAQMGRLYQTTTRWALIINMPAFLLLVAIPESILSVFGSSFVGGASALMVLACAELAMAITGTSGSIIDMTGHTRLKLFNSSIWIGLLVAGNFLLIPHWGVLGAAAASLIATGTVNFARVVEVWFLFRLSPYTASLLKPIASGLLALVSSLLVSALLPGEASVLTAAVQAVVLAVSYVGWLCLLGVAAEDRVILTRIAQRARSQFTKHSHALPWIAAR